MFSRNGQYIINELQEDTFDKQLPSSSVKVSFKREQERIFDKMQQKYEIQLLKEHIHQKCKAEELIYLDQLQKERQKFNLMKREEEKRKRQYLLKFVQNKYQIEKDEISVQKTRSKTQHLVRDSIDSIKDAGHTKEAIKIKKLQFSLEANEQKAKQKIQQDEWVKRVMQGRKFLEGKFGSYYSKEPLKKGTNSDNSSDAD